MSNAEELSGRVSGLARRARWVWAMTRTADNQSSGSPDLAECSAWLVECAAELSEALADDLEAVADDLRAAKGGAK